ncbi:MAG: hypothetical protein Fur0035_15030 [Anaerolineales bacterium]
MKTIIEKSKYLSLLAVITLLIFFVLALFWGIAQAVTSGGKIISSLGQSPEIIVSVIKLIDVFLVAMVLYILAASLYELFVGEVDLPSQLVAKNLTELKSKLSSIIVLVLAVHAVEIIFEQGVSGLEMIWQVGAMALIAAVLIAFSYFGSAHE